MQHKFRAWDAGRKRMVYRGLHDKNWYYTPCNDEHGCHLAYEVQQSDIRTLKTMQFTGLHDKNGEEIFEGDILDTGENNIYFVEYWLDRFSLCKKTENCFYRIALSVYGKSSLVIGNKFQNSELLQNQQGEA